MPFLGSYNYGSCVRVLVANQNDSDFKEAEEYVEGKIRYVGDTNFAQGIWIGVELDECKGKNDGSIFGQRYFSCKKNYGLFAREDDVQLIDTRKTTNFFEDNLFKTKENENNVDDALIQLLLGDQEEIDSSLEMSEVDLYDHPSVINIPSIDNRNELTQKTEGLNNQFCGSFDSRVVDNKCEKKNINNLRYRNNEVNMISSTVALSVVEELTTIVKSMEAENTKNTLNVIRECQKKIASQKQAHAIESSTMLQKFEEKQESIKKALRVAQKNIVATESTAGALAAVQAAEIMANDLQQCRYELTTMRESIQQPRWLQLVDASDTKSKLIKIEAEAHAAKVSYRREINDIHNLHNIELEKRASQYPVIITEKKKLVENKLRKKIDLIEKVHLQAVSELSLERDRLDAERKIENALKEEANKITNEFNEVLHKHEIVSAENEAKALKLVKTEYALEMSNSKAITDRELKKMKSAMNQNAEHKRDVISKTYEDEISKLMHKVNTISNRMQFEVSTQLHAKTSAIETKLELEYHQVVDQIQQEADTLIADAYADSAVKLGNSLERTEAETKRNEFEMQHMLQKEYNTTLNSLSVQTQEMHSKLLRSEQQSKYLKEEVDTARKKELNEARIASRTREAFTKAVKEHRSLLQSHVFRAKELEAAALANRRQSFTTEAQLNDKNLFTLNNADSINVTNAHKHLHVADGLFVNKSVVPNNDWFRTHEQALKKIIASVGSSRNAYQSNMESPYNVHCSNTINKSLPISTKNYLLARAPLQTPMLSTPLHKQSSPSYYDGFMRSVHSKDSSKIVDNTMKSSKRLDKAFQNVEATSCVTLSQNVMQK